MQNPSWSASFPGPSPDTAPPPEAPAPPFPGDEAFLGDEVEWSRTRSAPPTDLVVWQPRPVERRPPWFSLRAALAGGAVAALFSLALIVGFYDFTGHLLRYRAEQRLGVGDNAAAQALLASALHRDPDNPHLLLLKVKADLLSGDADSAFGLIDRLGDRADDAALVAEINPILERVTAAAERAEQAERLGDRDLQRAARLWEQASALYPESRRIAVSGGLARGAAALERRDVGTFLQLADALAAQFPDHPFVIAQLASAQAAQYAATGDFAWRARAEASLARAADLARAFDAADSELAAQVERIRYRLATRELLTRREYEKRFPPDPAPAPRH